MRKLVLACLSVLIGVGQAQAGGAAEKVIRETWDAAYLNGSKAGHVQTIVQELDRQGTTLYQTTLKYRLQVKRFDEVIALGMDIGSEEAPAGKVASIFMRQYLGKDKKLDLRGEVIGKQLKLMLDGNKPLKPAPWNEEVVSLFKQQTLFRDKQVKPGDQFSFLSFEPSINLIVNTHVKVMDYEMVEMFNSPNKQKLLRVETRIDPVQGVQLPMLVQWLDEQLEPVRSQTTMPIGELTLYRTTKAAATQGGGAAALADIGLSQLIKLNRKIINPYAVKKAVYRIQIKDTESPAKTVSHDLRQTVSELAGNSFELQIAAGPVAAAQQPPDEFIQSSYFINCEDAKVKQLAQLAVGLEKDPWKKALKIEKWVKQNMKARNHEAMAPADHVAKTLEGDCSEYAMLMAAMCRAEGVPAKTAMGLIYADLAGKGPVFSFHMWTEVWVGGLWMPLDATLGRGFVGATHIKITDHSWHDTRTLTPVLPLYNLLGKISVQVVRVTY